MPNLILIDGPPGSGKSSLATALAEALPTYKVCLEMDTAHPLHPMRVGPNGADFSELNTWDIRKLGDLMLAKWDSFLAQPGTYILESYPYQSHLRVLWQMDATEDLLHDWLSRLHSMLREHKPVLVMIGFRDFESEFHTVCERRGQEWTDYIMNFAQTTAYGRSRGMRRDSSMDFFRAYQLEVARWAESWPFKKLEIQAWTSSPPEQVEAILGLVSD